MSMKKTALKIRCVPRFGFEDTEVRMVDLDVPPQHMDERPLRDALNVYFASRGINDAVYAIDVDDSGFFAIINDEVYDVPWGEPLL